MKIYKAKHLKKAAKKNEQKEITDLSKSHQCFGVDGFLSASKTIERYCDNLEEFASRCLRRFLC